MFVGDVLYGCVWEHMQAGLFKKSGCKCQVNSQGINGMEFFIAILPNI